MLQTLQSRLKQLELETSISLHQLGLTKTPGSCSRAPREWFELICHVSPASSHVIPQAEDFVSKLGFHNTFIYRPPLLGRSQPRTTEKLARLFTKPMPVEHIGYCMRDIAERAFLSDTQPNNTRIIDSKQLWGMMDYAK